MKNRLITFVDEIRTQKKDIYTIFAVTFMALMAINGFFFTGFSLGHDSWDITLFQKELYGSIRMTQGRYLSYFINVVLFNGLNLPWITGIFECIHMALTSLIIIKLIDVQSRYFKMIIAVFIASSISLISMNCYVQEAYVYSLGILITTLGVYFLSKKKLINHIIGIIIITISLEMYQAHFTFALSLCALLLFKDILSESFNAKHVLKKLFKFLLCLAIAMIIYIISWELMIKLNGLEKTSYLGMDSLGIKSVLKIPYLIIPTYKNAVYELFRPGFKSYIPLYLTIINIIMSLIALYYAIKKLNKNKLQTFFFIILTLLLPIIIFFNYIISLGASASLPLKFSFVIIPILISYILYLNDTELSQILSGIFAFLIFFNSFIGGNITSVKRRGQYEEGFAFANQIISRIQNEAGFTSDKTVMFIGGEPENKPYSRDFAWCDNVEGANISQAMNNYVTTMSFLRRFSPLTEVLANDPKYIHNEKVLQLDTFPAQNCMTTIDDVFIIRLAKW